MKNETIQWFDLDGTIWETNAMWWIVDKNDPGTHLCRISQYEGSLTLGGFYKPDGHCINYNGIDGWLSDELWKKIQRVRKTKLTDIGISFREYTDVDLIEQQASGLITHVHRIKHLEGTSDVVNLLTARGNKKAHANLLDKLGEDLSALDIEIAEAYFVNDHAEFTKHGSTPEKKMMCILERIVGHVIEDRAFTPVLCDRYDESHFYDDEDKNILTCIDINRYLKEFLGNTQPWLSQQITEKVNSRSPVLYVNIVNTNELNPFDTTKVEIKI